jgi:uncharacterized damage-inducible protein DinB
MAQQTMSEIDAYRNTFEKEYHTTRRVLHEYPQAKASLKPGEKSRTAQELAWMMTLNQMVPAVALDKAELGGGGMPKAPPTWNEILAAFDKAHQETAARLARVTEEEWNSELKLPVAPKQMGSWPKGQSLWFFLYDSIHHRGEFIVYARIAGAKVPSIYGPTADESWT